ncbi:CBS domain-containing protein [Aliikangiella marina]|uniref:CBS domain-containing protein n=1 Tax=Aliikangiella marina TaxID=1712262 RepID=A0A545TJL9_9GAMM|nr:CBS domain-containing protein [Aliikangiella marina]TQV77423.1 CBS domain-containing protein [Aliikangiella marina]
MSFWIYNVGMGVPISEKRIYQLDKAVPLEELSKSARVHRPNRDRNSRQNADSSDNKSVTSNNAQKEHERATTQENIEAEEPSANRSAISSAADSRIISAHQNPYSDKDGQKRIYLAEQLMTPKVVSLRETMSLREVWASFRRFRYRHFTVVNERKQLVGIVADRDILNLFSDHQFSLTTTQLSQPVATIMTNHVLTASKKTLIKEICNVMFKQRIGAMPITSSEGGVSGIITRSDILRSMIKDGPLDLWL